MSNYLTGTPVGINQWADRVADFVERNAKYLGVLMALALLSRFFRLKVGVGRG